VAEALRQMPEYHRFIRGMVAWVGFRSTMIPYVAPARLAGKTKYSFLKMLRLAAHATFSFSLVPLYLAILGGCLFLLMAAAEATFVAYHWATGRWHEMAPGWASLMFVMLAAGGAILITSGLTGLYVGFIFQEVKRRPIFLIRTFTESRARQPMLDIDPESATSIRRRDRTTARG
jgi:dolichol-phosphate mannosyltransferase